LFAQVHPLVKVGGHGRQTADTLRHLSIGLGNRLGPNAEVGYKMNRNIKLLAGAILTTMLVAPQARAAHVVERIIARVNSEIITQHQFEAEKAKLHDELSQQYSGADLDAKLNDESKNLLRNLIDESLMVQKAKDEDVNVDTDLIKKLDSMRQQMKKDTIDDMEKEAEAQGINWEDFKEQIHRQLLMQEIISRDVGSRVVVSRVDMRKYYDAHKDEFKSEGMVHLEEILISNSKYKDDEAEKRAKAAEAELKGGAKFSVMVKKYSDDPSADQGGDIGMMKMGSMAPAIEAGIKDLDVNEFSDAIPIKSGFVILRVQEKFSAGIPPFEEVESRVNEILYSQEMEPKMRDYLTQLRKDSYIYLAPGYIDTGAETPGAALTSEKTQ
jgi:peptidyl-prolyl cis-trans isomerase SurA